MSHDQQLELPLAGGPTKHGGRRAATAKKSTISGATLSACRTYRYELWRQRDPTLPVLLWLMLNPSTADAELDDQTIRRCIGYAEAWGFGAILVRNLFAFRATDPKELPGLGVRAVGPENDRYLTGPVPAELQPASIGLTMAAWGTQGPLLGRDQHVIALYEAAGVQLHHLGLNVGGTPKHPSRVGRDVQPQLWRRDAA
jgi:hypothetical protein